MNWTRILVVTVGNSWQATVRDGPFWQVGEMKPTYLEAIESAIRPKKSPTDLGDLLA